MLAAVGHFTAIGAFAVVALAMVLYGSFVAITLSTGAWRRPPIPA